MINQIAPIPTDDIRETGYYKELLKFRPTEGLLQPKPASAKPENLDIWDPGMIAPYVVSVIKWID